MPIAATQTDLYQLTMAAAYFHRGFAEMRVTCEAFLRRLPPRRTFLVMAGTARLVDYLARSRTSRPSRRCARR
jgi:nicotinate phosphoribosyltransferase